MPDKEDHNKKPAHLSQPTAQDIQHLETAVKKLTRRIEFHNSIKHTFVLAVVRGVGTVLGATIVAGIVAALVINAVRSLESIPGLNWIIDRAAFEQKLEQIEPNN